MQAIKEEMFFPKTRSALSRRDLLIYEEQLCADLRSFIGFESHALYFPVEDELKAYAYVPEEKNFFAFADKGFFAWCPAFERGAGRRGKLRSFAFFGTALS